MPSPYPATLNIRQAGSQLVSVTSERCHPGLVESDPELDDISELSEAEIGELLDQSATSSVSQPRLSWRAWGKSQWYNVKRYLSLKLKLTYRGY